MSKTNDGKCKGCRIYDNHICRSIVPRCPCKICLIKMVCTKSCEEFSSHRILKTEAFPLERN